MFMPNVIIDFKDRGVRRLIDLLRDNPKNGVPGILWIRTEQRLLCQRIVECYALCATTYFLQIMQKGSH